LAEATGLPEHQCTFFDDFTWLPDIAMSKDDEEQGTSISQAHTLEEIADFWDAHSLGDYWEQTHEAAFEVRAKQKLISSAYSLSAVQWRRRRARACGHRDRRHGA
jgi:hypothetical protein